MGVKINKNSSLPLPVQVKNLIVERIRNSYYTPGQRIDSVKRLMDELSCCRLTILGAFNLLERENYVVRVPSHGIYVNEKNVETSKTVSIAITFPGKKFDPIRERYQQWKSLQELNTGYLIGCNLYNATVTYEYMEDNPSDLELKRQIKKLEAYDAVIMPSSSELLALKEKMAMIRPCFMSMKTIEEAREHKSKKTLINPFWFHEEITGLFNHVAERGCKTCGLIYPESSTVSDKKRDAQFEYLQARFSEFGLDLRHEFYLRFPWREQNLVKPLTKFFRKGILPDFIFWNIAESVRPLYSAAFSTGIRFGYDLKVAGRGVALEQFVPTFTHIKLPCEEIGIGAIRKIVKTICPNRDLGPDVHPQSCLMIGGSTNPEITGFEVKRLASNEEWHYGD